MNIKVGVIYGGKSVEHEVSVISAVQAMNNLNEEKYEVIPIYIDKDNTWYTGYMLRDLNIYKDFEQLKKYAKKVTLYQKNGEFVLQTTGFFKRVIKELDIVIPIVHGNNIEDGTIQGYLNAIGIPYVGSSVLGSSVGQDKVVMKQVMESAGIPIVPYTWFYDFEYSSKSDEILKSIKKLGYPVIVKPARLGSSVGITYVKEETEIDSAIIDAIKYDTKIIVEAAIPNLVEVNCSVMGPYDNIETSAIEEVMGVDEFLSYNDKYIGGSKGTKSKGMASTNRVIPARISDKLSKEVKELSKKVYKDLNLGGVCRIDFLIDSKKNKVYVNEPNTIPGSLSFYLWEPVGKKYSDLLDELIIVAIKEYKTRVSKVQSFDSNILKDFNGTKGSKTKLR